MSDVDLLDVFATGTTQPRATASSVTAGPISAIYEAGALRRICGGATELVRQIDFPVRDHSWGTCEPENLREVLRPESDRFSIVRTFEVADGALECNVSFKGHPDGRIVARGSATARRDFATKRTGFTVLHPIAGVAGTEVVVTSPNGRRRRAEMPELISPDQPVRDIARLEFVIDDARVAIDFVGETFEMEDQRNWSDASFKTYSHPLAEPHTHRIAAGETWSQSIHITPGPVPTARPRPARATTLAVGPIAVQRRPALLVAVERGWFPDERQASLLADLGVDGLVARTTPDDAADTIPRIAALASRTALPVDLEIEITDDQAPVDDVTAVATACAAAQLTPTRVVAVPRAYRFSYQPEGPWPTTTTPKQAHDAVRSVFPATPTGTGVFANFTELNRCRPDGIDSDYVTHANCAIVHAADDTSVLSTLTALPDVFRSGRALAGVRDYRLGMVAIGLRTNPLGAAPTPNPQQTRRALARSDPRVRGLFGAAWTVGMLAATERYGPDALTVGSPIGPFGLISSEAADTERPWFDEHPEAVVYPPYHVVRSLAGAHRRRLLGGLRAGLAGIAVDTDTDTTTRIVLTNLGETSETVELPTQSRVAVLDNSSFAAAARDHRWVDNALRPRPAIALDPLAVAFVDTGDSSPGVR